MNRKHIIKALQFHLKEWDYEPMEVQNNFYNDVRQYLSYMVKAYPALNLRN